MARQRVDDLMTSKDADRDRVHDAMVAYHEAHAEYLRFCEFFGNPGWD